MNREWFSTGRSNLITPWARSFVIVPPPPAPLPGGEGTPGAATVILHCCPSVTGGEGLRLLQLHRHAVVTQVARPRLVDQDFDGTVSRLVALAECHHLLARRCAVGVLLTSRL